MGDLITIPRIGGPPAGAKVHGILFSPEMVKEVIVGRKTVTRRTSDRWGKVKPGDWLVVRESVRAVVGGDGENEVLYCSDGARHRIENTEEAAGKWVDMYHYRAARLGTGATVPGIHMPRWAARLYMPIVSITRATARIDESEAAREGFPSVKEFERTLLGLNPGLNLDDELWRIEFKLPVYGATNRLKALILSKPRMSDLVF